MAEGRDYPLWIKALFCGGLIALAGSFVCVIVALFVPSMPGGDILMLPALAGLAALYAVSVYAPRTEAGRAALKQ